MFGLDRPGLPNRYDFAVCAETPGRVRTKAGVDLMVDRGLEVLATADTVIVAGWPLDEQPSPVMTAAIRAAHERGARIAALCSGTFLLAAAGLLDGREATTHWRMADRLQAEYPAVHVNPSVLYVDHGDVATSAGTAAAIDLCLHLVRTDNGAVYASEVARHMVTPPHRDGGQTQYTAVPETASTASLAELRSGPWSALIVGSRSMTWPGGPSWVAGRWPVDFRTSWGSARAAGCCGRGCCAPAHCSRTPTFPST